MRRSRITAGARLALVAGLAAGAMSQTGTAAAHPEDRLPALVTVDSADYDVELILATDTYISEDAVAFIRRTDDVGSSGDIPDPHGYVQSTVWGVTGGKRCVTLQGDEYSFPDAPDHGFAYGFAGKTVRRIEVVMADGTQVSARTSQERVDGWRGWMLERPLGTPVRVKGFAADGRLVTSAEISSDLWLGDWARTSTCTLYPSFP